MVTIQKESRSVKFRALFKGKKIVAKNSVFVSCRKVDWKEVVLNTWETDYLKEILGQIKEDFISEYLADPDCFKYGIPPMVRIRDNKLQCPLCCGVIEELLFRIEKWDGRRYWYVDEVDYELLSPVDQRRCKLGYKIKNAIEYQNIIPSIEEILEII